MEWINFETFVFNNGSISACYTNTTLGVPCTQGSVPVIGVDARSASDIQAAVKFAVKHNLRLAVKNTGHDLLGRSTARGAFLIWTHHLKDIVYNPSFVVEGAPSTETYNAITLGAGVQWHEAYDAIQKQGRVLVGGLTAGGSIGAAGGWLMGGGHSAIAPEYGLGVDNVIELNAVTSTGEYLTVNSYKYPDLFWALRGGGGGTYGVVVSVTYRTHPSVPLTGFLFTANSSINATINKLFTEFVRIHPDLSDAGFGGYTQTTPSSLQATYIGLNLSQAQTNQTIHPFFAFAQNLTSEGLYIETATITPFDSFYSWYIQFFSPTGVGEGVSLEMASRLIPRDTIENNYKDIANTIHLANGEAVWCLVAGGAVSRIDPDSTGLNPAWRRALAHVLFSESWEEGTSMSEINRLRNQLAQTLQRISDLTPGSGAYFNEASLFQPDFSYAFFGSHYEKLKMIKDIYDPVGLFIVTEGVGSEDWDKSLNCRC
jgi:hypothetical protein